VRRGGENIQREKTRKQQRMVFVLWAFHEGETSFRVAHVGFQEVTNNNQKQTTNTPYKQTINNEQHTQTTTTANQQHNNKNNKSGFQP
jgi:hypothetical protein